MNAHYVFALIITLVSEAGVAACCGYRMRRQQGAIAATNLFTHPLLHLALALLYPQIKNVLSWNAFFLMIEVLIVVGEAVLISWAAEVPLKKTIILSGVMNSVSVVLGVFLDFLLIEKT